MQNLAAYWRARKTKHWQQMYELHLCQFINEQNTFIPCLGSLCLSPFGIETTRNIDKVTCPECVERMPKILRSTLRR